MPSTLGLNLGLRSSVAGAAGAPAANGLLLGLTEAWMPDASLGMVGQKTALNTNTDAGLTYVAQTGFPGGYALQNATGSRITLLTPASALLQALGQTDFFVLYWSRQSLNDGRNVGLQFGENGNNGFDFNPMDLAGGDYRIFSEIPGADGNYQASIGSAPDTPYIIDNANAIATWYTTADSTLHVSCNAGTVYSIVNTGGIANADLLNTFIAYIGSETSTGQLGPAYLWQGTAGVANAVSHLASLYADKLAYSDFT